MGEIEYSVLVAKLAKPGEEILDSITADKLALLHMAVGISGEAGELLDAVKKHVIYSKSLDIGNVIEELGDLEFYMEGMRQELGLVRKNILDYNMTKLKARYPKLMYTDKDAQDRADKK